MSLAVESLSREAENEFLEGLRSEYEAKGYRFVVHPSRTELPEFLASYQPDAIALRHDHNVAVEVKSRSNAATQHSLAKIRKLFEGRSDWQLRVVFSGGDDGNIRQLPVLSKAAVLDALKRVDALVEIGDIRAAFISAWSLLEAALNSVLPEADKRPRTPRSVVQTLAMQGLISDETEQSLRSRIDLRNGIVHGDLTAMPNVEDVVLVQSAVRSVLAH